MLGLSLYDWQAKAIYPLQRAANKRVNIAVCAPNGSGKDDRIIPSAAFWWLFIHPKGRVVITTKSDLQLSTQTIPSLDKHWRKFGWKEPVTSPRYLLVTPTGGSLVAYVTNDGSRVEGHHSRPDSPLLLIVNEAKSVDDGIFQGIDRCTPDALMLISSPGLMQGRFYECFQKLAPLYNLVRAGLLDCPHKSQEDIDHVIATYGADHPITRSTLHGEFMTQADGEEYCLTVDELEPCLLFPPEWKPGFRYGFFDFADGRAENVFVVRNGNKYRIVDAWREVNEDAVVGRAIGLIRRENLKPSEVGGDAAAKSILDKMAQAGFAINRQNFGAKVKDSPYKSWAAMAWLEGCEKIRNREVIIPNDEIFKSQLTNRKKRFMVNGQLGIEEKYVLGKRGAESPDRVDAVFGAMAQLDTTLMVNRNNVIDFADMKARLDATDQETIGVSVGL